MTNWLLGGILAFAAATTIECFLLLGRAQLLLTHAEQLLATSQQLLALVPGKSAQPADGSDTKPRRWWQRLHPEPEPEPDEPAGDWRPHTHTVVDISDIEATDGVPFDAPGGLAEHLARKEPTTQPLALPAPTTQPDLKQASQVPPPAFDYEQWKRDLDAQTDTYIAAIRGKE